MYTTLATTLTQRYFPRANALVRDIFLVTFGSLLVAVFAQIRIPLPFTPVPITGQTLAVLLVGAALGSKRGSASMLLYLTLGLAGMPVFAGGEAGLAYLSGATGGYLLGFIVAAYAVGRLAERGLERKFRTAILPFLIGQSIIYGLGVLWLGMYLGNLNDALVLGFYPFVIGDLMKMAFAAALLPATWKLVR
jgi:biotin transport system substrate-specific component